jgi:hypothetical protein
VLDFHQFSHVTDTFIASQPFQQPYEPESGTMMMDTVGSSEILEGSSTTQRRNQKESCQLINIGRENLKPEQKYGRIMFETCHCVQRCTVMSETCQ